MRLRVFGSVLSTAGIEKAFVFSGPALAHIDRELLFAGQPLPEEVAFAALPGRAGGGDVFKIGQIVHHLRPDAGLLHVAARVDIFGIDKCAGLIAFGVLKPAIVVHNLGAE